MKLFNVESPPVTRITTVFCPRTSRRSIFNLQKAESGLCMVRAEGQPFSFSLQWASRSTRIPTWTF
ncbi:Hypothetical protein FKW44_005447 [Caligus rogercresseyi]|uniref:Uncharacterized protein n=1 Tax=Caligus rogercresseyi TaxID=217165 RepID=A0A7T8KBY7_CALRO|nr:Hypothetical protein FKW44_005447 [Caligus rogercresseyi]